MRTVLLLLSSMDEPHRLQAEAEPTAKEIFESLERQYANKSAASKHRVISEMLRYKKNPAHNVNQYVAKLKEMRASLASLGESQSEEIFQVIVIESMPAEYGMEKLLR